MNAEGLLEHYARMADAPDAIAKLRRFVLDLAVRGKLVAQDPEDEPATKLVEKICSEKARLSKLGGEKAEQPAELASEPVFDLPESWQWVPATFPVILSSDNGRKIQTKSVLEAGEFPVVDQGKVFIRGYCNDESKVTRVNGHLILFGDHTREAKLIDFDFVVGADGVKLLKPVCIDARYYFIALQWLPLDSRGYSRHFKLLRAAAISLPPLGEQHRIVAKVDELMALCDQLEAARAQREATRDRLAAASLSHLNAPDPATFPADVRFALDALPALTARPDQIKQLRQTILNLAVRGKLVPQDPSDEPAITLLASIATQRAKSSKAGLKKKYDLQPVDASQAPFDLPTGWAWGRFPKLGEFGRGKSKHRPRNDARLFEGGTHPLIQTGDVARSNGVIKTITNQYNDLGLAQSLKWPKGTLCITIAANIADSGLLTFDACFPDSVVGFVPAPMFKSAAYFEYFVRTAKANLLEFAPATAQKNINLEILNSVLIPIPPLTEQEHIVAKVDELMGLCDQLEASLTSGETTRRRLLDALLHEALVPTAKPRRAHPRAAVSSYVISRLASKRNFGRTAHMKHLYLAESRLGLDLRGHYARAAAGPLDTGIYELEKQAEAAGWYTTSVEILASGNLKVSYQPGKGLKAIADEGIVVLGASRAEMDRLIDLMSGLKTEHVEIIVTLFAAWNDALLDGHTPDDGWIVKEVREHWHVSKQRFTPAGLQTWLQWMRQNDVVPLGHPPRTMQQIAMEL